MRLISLILAILLFSNLVFSKDIERPAILMMGDSWAAFMCLNGSLAGVLKENKVYNKVKIRGCINMTDKGSTSHQWASEKYLNRIEKKIRDSVDIKIVILSVGGNDMRYHWNPEMTPAEEWAAFEESYRNVQKIIDKIQDVRSDIKVLVSGYDYPNFLKFTKLLPKFVKAFNHHGRPSPDVMNARLLRISKAISKVDNGDNVRYVHHFGLMHYYFGNSRVGLMPRQTLPPEEISPPENPMQIGGNPEIENDTEAMFKIRILTGALYQDPFHLGKSGFKYLAKHLYDNALKKWLDELLQSKFQEQVKEAI